MPRPDVQIIWDTPRVAWTSVILPSTLGILAPVFLTRPGPCIPMEHQVFTLEEDLSDLTNLNNEALEEEFLTLAYYTHWASIVLAIGGADCKDVILIERFHKDLLRLYEEVVMWRFSTTCTCSK